MREKVLEIISSIAKRGDERIGVEELSARADEQGLWDSLLHVELVVALETEFDLFFTQEEIADIDTPAKVIKAVESKVVAREA